MFYKNAEKSFTPELQRTRTPFVREAMPLDIEDHQVKKFWFVAEATSSSAFAVVKRKSGKEERVSYKELKKVQKQQTEDEITGVEHYLEGVASSTSVDHEYDRMSEDCLKTMQVSASLETIPLRNAHSYEWDADIGVLTDIEVKGEGDNALLHVQFKLNDFEFDSTSKKLWKLIGDGEEIGLSIGGMVIDYEWEINEEIGMDIIVFKMIMLKEVSVTKNPANPDTFISAIGKSLKKSREIAGLDDISQKKTNKKQKCISTDELCKALGQKPLDKSVEEISCAIIKMSTEDRDVLTNLLSKESTMDKAKTPEVETPEVAEEVVATVETPEVEADAPVEPEKTEVETVETPAEPETPEVTPEVADEAEKTVEPEKVSEVKEKSFTLTAEELDMAISKAILKAVEPLQETIKTLSEKPVYKEAVPIMKGEAMASKSVKPSGVTGADLNKFVSTPKAWFDAEKNYSREEASAVVNAMDPHRAHTVVRGNIIDAFVE